MHFPFQKVCESFQKEKGGQIKARVTFDKMENLRDNGKLLMDQIENDF